MSSNAYPGVMTATPAAPWLDPNEARAWRALWAVMTWLPARLDAQLRADSGMSLAEYGALSQISEAPGRSLRLSDLARSANMTLSHLSRVIGRMERVGWVERVPDPHDGRSTLGRLTEAGWEKVRQAAPEHVRIVRELVFASLDPAQVEAFGGAAEVIARLVAPARPGPTAPGVSGPAASGPAEPAVPGSAEPIGEDGAGVS